MSEWTRRYRAEILAAVGVLIAWLLSEIFANPSWTKVGLYSDLYYYLYANSLDYFGLRFCAAVLLAALTSGCAYQLKRLHSQRLRIRVYGWPHESVSCDYAEYREAGTLRWRVASAALAKDIFSSAYLLFAGAVASESLLAWRRKKP